MRASGILMHISSLPSPYGIGTFGKEAYAFADFLAAAGQKYWQILPLGPTGYGDSPYQTVSAFAGNPYFIDLDLLAADGLLEKEEILACDWGADPEHADYGALYAHRGALLKKAFERGRERDRKAVDDFRRENAGWLESYALFTALKTRFGLKPWSEWEDEAARLRSDPKILERYSEELREEIDCCVYIQYLFYRQWDELRAYIHKKGIRIIGDVPIYVPLDSADVWSDRSMFQLDGEGRPTEVAGVPPDYFSEDGQLWGNPLYDWDRMAEDGYAFHVGTVGQYDHKPEGLERIELRLAESDADFNRIGDMLYSDPDYGTSYSPGELASQLRERYRLGQGRSYVGEFDGTIVVHGCVAAECDKFALLNGGITDPSWRHKGVCTKLLFTMSDDLSKVGKRVYSMYYNPIAAALHRKAGYVDCCEWGRLFLKTH